MDRITRLESKSDYRVRVALAELTNDDQATEPGPASVGDEDAA